MMRALLIAAILSCPCTASAKTTVEFKLMPPGEQGLIGTDRAQCYRLELYLELAAFDAELMKLRADVLDLKDLNTKLELKLKEKDKVIAALESDKDILTKRGIRLQDKWDKCEDEVIELSGGPIWPYVVGIAGVVVGAVGLGMWLGSPSK